MSTFAESLARLRAADKIASVVRGTVSVRLSDLNALLNEFARIEKLVSGEFVDLGLDAATKLIATESVPEGFVVISDQSGKVHYVGPVAGLPPFNDEIKRVVMNVHPNTLRAIGAAVEKRNG